MTIKVSTTVATVTSSITTGHLTTDVVRARLSYNTNPQNE